MEDENSTFTSDDIKNIKLPSTTWKSGYLEDGCLNFLALKKKNKVWQFKNCFQCSLLISEPGKMRPCKFCKLLNNALRILFKRHKTIKLHTKIKHKYLSMKQLSRKVVAKAKREAQLKFTLKKKNEEIMKLKGDLKDIRLKLATVKYDQINLDKLSEKSCSD
ncbi:Uncharacterized protein APZ42_010368 [Daphnia magna]|uniref:Uncharacterized protein n=1 Tax=Daphnia magna TaxID=35525 RepID=A0A162CX68_9CRUS|nr:Uncharacterized protein APZ42_010368 [Daphnia magna]